MEISGCRSDEVGWWAEEGEVAGEDTDGGTATLEDAVDDQERLGPNQQPLAVVERGVDDDVDQSPLILEE